MAVKWRKWKQAWRPPLSCFVWSQILNWIISSIQTVKSYRVGKYWHHFLAGSRTINLINLWGNSPQEIILECRISQHFKNSLRWVKDIMIENNMWLLRKVELLADDCVRWVWSVGKSHSCTPFLATKTFSSLLWREETYPGDLEWGVSKAEDDTFSKVVLPVITESQPLANFM